MVNCVSTSRKMPDYRLAWPVQYFFGIWDQSGKLSLYSSVWTRRRGVHILARTVSFNFQLLRLENSCIFLGKGIEEVIWLVRFLGKDFYFVFNAGFQ